MSWLRRVAYKVLLLLLPTETDVSSYNHVRPKRTFSVKTQYIYIGGLKQRLFLFDKQPNYDEPSEAN